MKEFPKFDERSKRLCELISPKRKDKILVIGTGVYPKIEAFLVNNFGCKFVTSGDIDRKNLNNAKKVLPKARYVYLDAQKRLPFKSKTFDKVILTEVLEHLKDEKIALSEIKRVLRKKGKLIMSVPRSRWFNFFSPITWVQHEREYTEPRLSKVLIENGFKVEKMRVGGTIFDLFNLWIHLIFKYVFRTMHIDNFFSEKIDRTYKPGFKGKGTDILARASIDN